MHNQASLQPFETHRPREISLEYRARETTPSSSRGRRGSSQKKIRMRRDARINLDPFDRSVSELNFVTQFLEIQQSP